MIKRNVFLASVCAAFLAASAAVSGPAAAANTNSDAELARSAYKALTAGDPATAIASYTQAIESRKLEPEVLANALLNRGLAYQRLNQHARNTRHPVQSVFFFHYARNGGECWEEGFGRGGCR